MPIRTASARWQGNLTEGSGTASVDQYPGIAGSGWSGAWSTGNLAVGGITAAGGAIEAPAEARKIYPEALFIAAIHLASSVEER